MLPDLQVLTHGFVLDEKGYKMSKSLGNVVDPKLVIEGGANQKTHPGYGADVLRLWVSSVNYASDVCIGDGIIKQCFDSYRKLRNTARYLLGSLHDYDPTSHAVPYDELPALDRYILGVLHQFTVEAKAAYDEYAFSRVFSLLQQFAVSDLSNFYLDIAKDRLYIAAADSARRRSCQTVMASVLSGFTAALAPIMPHMAEDIWQALPYDGGATSIFQSGWPSAGQPIDEGELAEWVKLRELRDVVNKVSLQRSGACPRATQLECLALSTRRFNASLVRQDELIMAMLLLLSPISARRSSRRHVSTKRSARRSRQSSSCIQPIPCYAVPWISTAATGSRLMVSTSCGIFY